MNAETVERAPRRYGMVIDLDRCSGCGACMVACSAENNVPPAHPQATERTGITLLRVVQVKDAASRGVAFIPMMCQQCGDDTPCMTVCPQQAVEVDKLTGVVEQMPQRCLGCRYCMTACPFQARFFNWWDPEWPAGMETTLNPGAAPRMRGVVEKCDFCQSRMHAAEDKAAMEGSREFEYTPACVEACPTRAIVFGDLNDPESDVSRQARNSFRFLERLGTGPKVYYRSRRPWLRTLASRVGAPPKKENGNG
ncbi:MAG: 4Fe-4S dicluster domain-containing protein [Bryobacterales bacterium]|nr:4Fe-4S dicluster domain-containing protein [Bryobacterales bacterium]